MSSAVASCHHACSRVSIETWKPLQSSVPCIVCSSGHLCINLKPATTPALSSEPCHEPSWSGPANEVCEELWCLCGREKKSERLDDIDESHVALVVIAKDDDEAFEDVCFW